MNRFILNGVIKNIKYLQDAVVVYVDDMEKGYTTQDGKVVNDMIYTWKVIFKSNPFKGYITRHFNDGMLVDIDAKMRPYSLENGEEKDGYSCIGIAINRSCYVRQSYRVQKKLMKDSQMNSDEKPNLEEYNKPDF